MDDCAGRSSLEICFSAVREISTRQLLLSEAKPPLQLRERDGGFAALERGDAL